MMLAAGNARRVCRRRRSYIFRAVFHVAGIEAFDNEVAGICLNRLGVVDAKRLIMKRYLRNSRS